MVLDNGDTFAADYMDYMEAIDSILGFNGAVGIYRKGQIVFEDYRGVEVMPDGPLVQESTKFPIASLTKTFTAIAVLRLEEAGLVDLEQTIDHYLPYYPRDLGSRISVLDLLNHSSGLPDYTNRHEEINRDVAILTARGFILKYCTGDPVFPPGTDYSYSNTGYYILGGIIEQVTQRPYMEAISQIFGIAHMGGSGFLGRDGEQSSLGNLAKGYMGDKSVDGTQDFVELFSAGGLYSTVGDMVSWYQSLTSHQLISKASLSSIFSFANKPYCKGWALYPIKNRRAYGHSGGLEGYSAHMLAIPDHDIFVVAFTNAPPLPLQKIVSELALIAMGEKVVLPRKRKSIVLPKRLLEHYAGDYGHKTSGNSISVLLDDDGLSVEILGERLPLHALAPNQFYFHEFGPILKFEIQNGGNCTWIENGNEFVYQKTDGDPNGSGGQLVLGEDMINEITGTYNNSESGDLEVLYQNGKLYLMEHGNKRLLEQKSGLDFFYRETRNGFLFKYPVEFQKEGDGVNLLYDDSLIFGKKDD